MNLHASVHNRAADIRIDEMRFVIIFPLLIWYKSVSRLEIYCEHSMDTKDTT